MQPKPQPLKVPIVSHVPDDGSAIVELVHDGANTRFAIHRRGTTTFDASFPKDEFATFVPFRPTNNIIRNRVVLFPERPEPYGSPDELLDEVRWYLHRWVDLSPPFERIAALYVMLTWVHDCFDEVPYLRVRGDYGSGKTRFLLVAGAVCYKPTFASGASTVSPLFHLLDSFRGTLVIDEADFRWSDEKAEIVKLLNNGTVRGMPVLRTHVSHDREYNPRAYQVFGPKIIATRGSYDDPALESRFITEEMGTRPLRADIPITLPAVQRSEAASLRNKLLAYRFDHRLKLSAHPHFFRRAVEPRLKQMFVPLLSLIDDPVFQDELEELAETYSHQLALDRGLSIEAQVLTAIRAASQEGAGIAIGEVATAFERLYGSEYEERVTPRWIGTMVRKKLRLSTRKSNGSYVIPTEELPRLNRLFDKYGIEEPVLDVSVEPLDVPEKR